MSSFASLPVSPAFPRRSFLTRSAVWAGGAWLASQGWAQRLMAATETPVAPVARYRVSVCDWMILKRQKLGAITLAKELGADGVELDIGGLGDRPAFDNKLRDPAVRTQFLDQAKASGIAFSSLAMSGFYAQSFARRPGVETLIDDCLETMVGLGIATAFLPLGVQGDLRQHPELRPAIVERLRMAGAKAERAGVVIAIETALEAAGEAALLDEVGSPAIRSYFNLANALQNGRDVHAEIRTLGRDRIRQIHCSDEDGVWLEHNPRLSLPRLKETLDALGWSGWLVIERSRDVRDARNVKANFGANVAYVKKIFQAGPDAPLTSR